MSARPTNRIKAVRAAEELLKWWGDSSLPVDVEGIAKKQNIAIEVKALPVHVFGATAHDGLRMRILVSTLCETKGNRRFTIAHELGHCCIEEHAEALLAAGETHHSSGSNDSSSERSPIEIEADCFAAALLLPAKSARELASRYSPSIELIIALSDCAEVSRMTAAIRSTELVDDPFSVILSVRGTIKWAAHSSGMKEHFWAQRSSKGCEVPIESSTMEIAKKVARKKTIDDSIIDIGTSSLADWYPGAPAISVREEVLSLGDYGLLTVLHPTNLPSHDQLENEREIEAHTNGDWRDALRTYRFDDYSPDL